MENRGPSISSGIAWLAWIAVALAAAGAQGAPAESSAPPRAPAVAAWGATARGWLDDQGRPVDLRRLGDAPLVLTMAYVGCHRICPTAIHHLEALQRELDANGGRATFIVLGYDPANDDPATWSRFRQKRGLGRPNWLFLTARDDAQVRRAADALGFEYWRYDEHVMHDERIVALSADGRVLASAGPGEQLHARDLPAGAARRPVSSLAPARLAAGATGS